MWAAGAAAGEVAATAWVRVVSGKDVFGRHSLVELLGSPSDWSILLTSRNSDSTTLSSIYNVIIHSKNSPPAMAATPGRSFSETNTSLASDSSTPLRGGHETWHPDETG